MWVGVRLTDADCADASQTDRLLLVRLPSPRVSQSFEMRARATSAGTGFAGSGFQEDVAAEAVKIRVGEPLTGFLREPQPFVYKC